MKHGRCDIFVTEFETKEEAKDFIKNLESIHSKYGYTTLADAKDLVYGDNRYSAYMDEKYKLPKGKLKVQKVTKYVVSIPYNFRE